MNVANPATEWLRCNIPQQGRARTFGRPKTRGRRVLTTRQPAPLLRSLLGVNQLVEFEGTKIRMVGTADRPEWIAADVCQVLGLAGEPSDQLKRFKPSEKGTAICRTPSGGPQQMLTVTEPGLYRLIFKSRKPEAERFREFVYHKVLPSIREHGCYPPPQVATSRGALINLDVEQFQRNLANAIGTAIGQHVGPMQQDIAELKTDVRDIKSDISRIAKRKPITPETRRLFVRVVAAVYQGYCPCCSKRKILFDSSHTNDFAQVDHWRLPSQNDRRWTWLVCDQCNLELRDPDFHDAHEGRFKAFQENVKHTLNIIQPRLPGLEELE